MFIRRSVRFRLFLAISLLATSYLPPISPINSGLMSSNSTTTDTLIAPGNSLDRQQPSAPASPSPANECGTWYWSGATTLKDSRILVTRSPKDLIPDCRGNFTLHNNTDIAGFGGYTLEVEARSGNARFAWGDSLLGPGSVQIRADLLPPVPIDLLTFVDDKSLQASVIVEGNATLRSLQYDVALFFLRTALALTPECGIPAEYVGAVAYRTSNILDRFVDLMLQDEVADAWEELGKVGTLFFEHSAEELRALGVDIAWGCAANALKGVAKKLVIIYEIATYYWTWIAVLAIDMKRYEGQSVEVALTYTPPAPTSIGSGSDRIAFNCGFDLCSIKLDGTGQKLLTRNGGSLAWAPSGTRIAFDSTRSGSSQIYVINADGTGLKQLTRSPENGALPFWSPDGTRIVFQSNRDGINEIYMMNNDGTGQTRLTNDPADDALASWSPDGARIAFVSNRDGNSAIYVMNADGTGLTRLTDKSTQAVFPDWSPDSKRIVFNSNRSGNDEIYVMNADGTNLFQLTNNSWADDYPVWSPDGTMIAFDSRRDGHWQVYLMNADGTGQTRLTNDALTDFAPAWQP